MEPSVAKMKNHHHPGSTNSHLFGGGSEVSLNVHGKSVVCMVHCVLGMADIKLL